MVGLGFFNSQKKTSISLDYSALYPLRDPLALGLEIWVFEAYIAPEMGNTAVDPHQIADALSALRREVHNLNKSMGKG